MHRNHVLYIFCNIKIISHFILLKINNRKKPTCKKCGKKYKTKTTLLRHVREVHNEMSKHHCPYCDLISTRKDSVNVHITRAHPHRALLGDARKENADQALIYKRMCSTCSKMFPNENLLKSHIKQVHDKKPAFKCRHCDKMFEYQSRYEAHFKREHFRIREHECHVCHKMFSSNSYLKIHLKKH